VGCDVGEASGEEEIVGEGAVGFGDGEGLCVDVGFGVGFAVATGVGSISEDGVGEGLCDGLN